MTSVASALLDMLGCPLPMRAWGRGKLDVQRSTWLTVAAALALVLAVVNMVLFDRNRTLQTEINARAQYIQQTVQIEAVNREIISAIANLSVRNQDGALRTILTQHGITVSSGEAAPGAAPATGPAAVEGTPRR
jgi:hypothetical protein